MEQEKKCQNCKHYVAHYVIDNTRLLSIDGHCINHELNEKQIRNRYRLHENCEHWESDVSRKIEQKENIKTALREINKHLKQMEMILKANE